MHGLSVFLKQFGAEWPTSFTAHVIIIIITVSEVMMVCRLLCVPTVSALSTPVSLPSFGPWEGVCALEEAELIPVWLHEVIFTNNFAPPCATLRAIVMSTVHVGMVLALLWKGWGIDGGPSHEGNCQVSVGMARFLIIASVSSTFLAFAFALSFAFSFAFVFAFAFLTLLTLLPEALLLYVPFLVAIMAFFVTFLTLFGCDIVCSLP